MHHLRPLHFFFSPPFASMFALGTYTFVMRIDAAFGRLNYCGPRGPFLLAWELISDGSIALIYHLFAFVFPSREKQSHVSPPRPASACPSGCCATAPRA